MRRLFFIVLSIACATSSLAQGDLEFWRNAKGYMARQNELAFQQSARVLDACPPDPANAGNRRLALLQLDLLLHDTTNDTAASLQQYMARRTARIAEDLAKPVKGKTIRIYKVYNHGFIVKSRHATVAFDLYRGHSRGMQLIPEYTMNRLIDQCDILFISHRDGDHADAAVAAAFCAKGKRVIAPPDALPSLSGVTRVREEQPLHRSYSVRGHEVGVDILPGHQDDVANNVYLVTLPGGKHVMHTGDQYNADDVTRLPRLAATLARPDVLLVNCWTLRFGTFVGALRPGLVITGHENELGHSVDHREAYWMSFAKLDGLRLPFIVMSWGEWTDR